jgi:hypothetical protein
VAGDSVEVPGDDAADAPKPVAQPSAFTAPRTLKELYDEAQRSGVSPADARLTVMETIGRMNPEQLQTLLTAEANNPDFFRRMRFDFQFAARRRWPRNSGSKTPPCGSSLKPSSALGPSASPGRF